jgi:hypothetical protein
MHKAPTSAKELVERLGGLQQVSEILGVTAQAVWNAQDRGCFATGHWNALVEAAAKAPEPVPGVTLEWLLQLSKAASKREVAA